MYAVVIEFGDNYYHNDFDSFSDSINWTLDVCLKECNECKMLPTKIWIDKSEVE